MKLYGIKNCDTVKKARAWIAERGVNVAFHDFKTEGVSPDLLDHWERNVGWEVLLNRKGTTWRGLSDEVKESVTDAMSAKRLMLEKPSIIKRPVLETGNDVHVGFSIEIYSKLFK